ncbi:MAG TPA: DNA polymerase III subunit delta' [Gammaproteobacteria bacterium]|nr:DNA polymerase III subunit delta' [Gammaproteobacteria bacterium]
MNVADALPDWRAVPLPWQTSLWQRAGAWLQSGRLPHALMLTGVEGSGKQLFAGAFAARALCRSPENDRACGHCPSCRQFAAGGHPDYHYLTRAEEKSAILVDQIRELCATLALTSLHGGRKLAVLSPADAMNSNAANSLLKTLEEPAPGTLLILVTAQPARLPATIRSRCQVLGMTAPATHTALDWLNGMESRADWPELLGIAGGGPLLALQLAGVSLVRERLVLFQMLLDLRSNKLNPLQCAGELSREPLPLVLRLLQTWTMDLVRLGTAAWTGSPALINADAHALLQSALAGLNLRALHAYLGRLNRATGLAAAPVNARLLLEDLLLQWAEGLGSLNAAPLAAAGG